MSRTTGEELEQIGYSIFRPKGPFIGVYSMDKLPKKFKPNCMFIVNTDTSNLAGTHWIAVKVRDSIGYVFDPLGFPPPLMLSSWMNNYCTKWSSNTRELQLYTSNLCGQFCIYFIFFATAPYLEDYSFDAIVNVIFPLHQTRSEYEKNVLEFFNNPW